MRVSFADYRVVAPWSGTPGRYVCRPPDRLARAGEVLVSELKVDADDRQQLFDLLLRMSAAPGGRLVEVIEGGPDPDTGGTFVATAPVPKGTLSERAGALDRAGRLEAVDAAARAVHALHEVGLAHGSLHPGSILLTGEGAVLDLPRLDAPPGEVVRVSSWRELVTVDPQVLGGESPSRSSDVWSLGATLHCVLSDRPLFPGIEEDEPVTAVQRMMFTRPEPDPSLPPPLVDLIRGCLAHDPADRPQNAMAVADGLRHEVGR